MLIDKDPLGQVKGPVKLFKRVKIQDILSAVINTIKRKSNCFKALGTNSMVHCS